MKGDEGEQQREREREVEEKFSSGPLRLIRYCSDGRETMADGSIPHTKEEKSLVSASVLKKLPCPALRRQEKIYLTSTVVFSFKQTVEIS